MAKGSSQSKYNDSSRSSLRMRLKWATFCKSVAQEPDSGETTLIGVLPGLKVDIETLPVSAKGPFNLPIPLWVHAVFTLEPVPSELMQEPLEAVFNLNEISSALSLKMDLKPNESLATLNLRLAIKTGLPLKAGNQTLSLVFRHNGHDIGKVELPIGVTVKTVNKLG
jgi:hypothetical protein